MGVDTAASIWIVTGSPGSGKSTVSRGLAGALHHAARVAADDLQAMLVSGAVWALGEPADEAARQVDLCYRNVGALSANFARAGFSTVIDCVVPDADHLDRLLGHLPAVPVSLVVLDPGGAVCRARNAQRPAADRFDFDDHEGLRRSMRSGFGDRGWWIDTAEQSVERTVHDVVEGAVAGRRGRLDPAGDVGAEPYPCPDPGAARTERRPREERP